MSSKLKIWGVFAFCLLTTGVLLAQPANNSSSSGATFQPGTFNYPYYQPGNMGGGGFGGGFGGWGGFGDMGVGSTVAGSALTGMGNAIRAQGQYNLATSAAAINLEEANKRDIENRERWTNAYFEMRRINQAYQQSQKPAPGSPDTWARLARQAAPNRLETTQLDPVNGAIRWPGGLQGEIFRKDRETLDHLFSERALLHGAIGVESNQKIRSTVANLLETLKSRINDYTPRMYIDLRNFVNSLGFEASLPTGDYAAQR